MLPACLSTDQLDVQREGLSTRRSARHGGPGRLVLVADDGRNIDILVIGSVQSALLSVSVGPWLGDDSPSFSRRICRGRCTARATSVQSTMFFREYRVAYGVYSVHREMRRSGKPTTLLRQWRPGKRSMR